VTNPDTVLGSVQDLELMAERLQILYLITSTNVGGAEKALLELILRIDRKKYAIYVCSLKRPGRFAKKIAAAADGFHSLELSEAGGIKAVLNFLPSFIGLVRLTARLRPLIIHSFLFRANIYGRIAGRIAGVPVIISSVRVIESEKNYKHLIDRLTSSLVHKYMAVSEAVREFTIKHVHISPHKIVTVYNGIDKNRSLQQEPHSFKVNISLTNIGLIGRLDRQKGHGILIRALKIVIPQEPDIKVYFFGEGPAESNIKHMVEHAGLSKQVSFMGTKENITACISLMDIIVLPSLWEGLPNVLLEAMAEARPVVASRIEGVDEVVVNGETGILFEPGDAQALSEALFKLIRDKKCAEEMGRAGRARVHEKFSIDKTVSDTLEIYQNLLTEHMDGQDNISFGR